MSARHLKFIDTLPCIVCGWRGESTHHHLLRVGCQYLTATAETSGLMFPKIKSKGMGTKSEDRFCLPVCPRCHAEIHRHGNDRDFLRKLGIAEPEQVALILWHNSGDYATATREVEKILKGKKCSGFGVRKN